MPFLFFLEQLFFSLLLQHLQAGCHGWKKKKKKKKEKKKKKTKNGPEKIPRNISFANKQQ